MISTLTAVQAWPGAKVSVPLRVDVVRALLWRCRQLGVVLHRHRLGRRRVERHREEHGP